MSTRGIRYGRAEVIGREYGHKLDLSFCGIVTLIRFRKRYYTVYGRSFAVPGKWVNYKDGLNKRQYMFLDFNNFINMAAV